MKYYERLRLGPPLTEQPRMEPNQSAGGLSAFTAS